MILTSNQSFGSWGDVFGDRVIASAILDGSCITRRRSASGAGSRLKDKLEVGGGQADRSGSVRDGKPVDAAGVMVRADAPTASWTGRTACPQPQRTHLIALSTSRWGNFRPPRRDE